MSKLFSFKSMTQFLQRDCEHLKNNSYFVKSYGFCFIKASTYSTESSRILIVASKKVGNAPERNYFRRCTKEAFFKLAELLPKKDYVIIFRRPLKKITYHNIFAVFTDMQKILSHESFPGNFSGKNKVSE